MKISNKIAAALLALSLVSGANAADPVVYLTGSSAFRSTVELSLKNNSGPASGGVFDAGTVTYETWGGSEGSANYMVFHGTIGGNGVYINCAWSGSEAGIASACNTTLGNADRNGNSIALAGSPETWVNATNAGVTLTQPGTIISTNPASTLLESSSHGADLAQADTSQAVSWTPAVANTQTALKDYGSEGAVTFTWSRNVQLNPTQEWLDCSNLTLPQINVLLSSGWVPAGFISGNPADDGYTVYVVGRNRGSGTRMNALSCSTYGAHNPVKQYSIGYGVEASEPQQANTLWLTNENNGGYESGGGVGVALANTDGGTKGSCQQADPFHGGTGWFAVGYLSPSDAIAKGEAPTNWVTLDGVASNNQNIENGSYWFWGHEHLYGKYQISGVQNTVGTALFNGVTTTLTTGTTYGQSPTGNDPGIPYGLMTATKASDVSFPLPF
jgi:hypothetical protein